MHEKESNHNFGSGLYGNGSACLWKRKKHIDKESEINVYKEEYTPEKKHREDPLELKRVIVKLRSM